MFTRTSTLRHRLTGVAVQTPLLVPSFSSKGFGSLRQEGQSEISTILSASGEFLTDTFLISAYDIFYQHIPQPSDLTHTPDIVILDSGGYEISTDRDYSSIVDPLPAPEEWDVEKWESVVTSWPPELPLIAVSYDHHKDRRPFAEQVTLARDRFKNYPQHLHSFLIKPEKTSQMTLEGVLMAAMADAEALGHFDVVGVTEKELGRSMIERMVRIARLRRAMDEANVTAPLHIFGALDPVSVCLYFISGAELFDGLTWIRYAFHEGRCIYIHNFGVLKYGLYARDDTVRSRALAENYYSLQDLERRLQEFHTTKNFEKLQPHSKLLQDACDSLQTKLNRRE